MGELQIFHDDDNADFVIAYSVEDAKRIMVDEENAIDSDTFDDGKWTALDPASMFSRCDSDDHTNPTTMTCAEWCAKEGRGHFASSDY
jgi:hypothetical protein